jgi:uncharacterized protein YidB (DUF937 family)
MSVIEAIASAALQQAAGSSGSAVTSLVLNMLGNRSNGGMGGLVRQFTTAGLGEIIGSWVSTGPNMTPSPEHIRMALGQGQVQSMAQQTGLPVDQLLAGLAQQMPALINHLTPQGQIPQQGALDDTLAQLRQRLGLG